MVVDNGQQLNEKKRQRSKGRRKTQLSQEMRSDAENGTVSGCLKKEKRNANVPVKLSCLYANARSIVNKYEELEIYIENEKPHVIAITESWATTEIGDSEICINGYTLFRKDREGVKRGGGVLLYVKSDLPASLRTDIKSEQFRECVWCDINCGLEKTLFGICYRPPDSKAEDDEGLFQILSSVSNEPVVIMGDFNFPTINWELHSADEGKSIKFVECVEDCFLWQHVDKATRGDNVLDLVFSSEKNMIENLKVEEPFGTSDHCVIRYEVVVSSVNETTE
jgi:hypothetical protein